MFFRKKYIQPKYIPIICIVAFIASFAFFDYVSSIYDAIVDTEKVGGSNTEMRDTQLELAQYFMQQSYWVGNGLSYSFEYVANYFEAMAGAESLWFPLMIDQGMIGIITYIIYIFSCARFIIKSKQTPILFFLIGMLVFNTMSSIPEYYFIYLIMYIQIMISERKFFGSSTKAKIRY